MTIRTLNDLSDKLNFELAWRKKELSDLKYYIDQPNPGNPGMNRRDRVLGRCSVALLYAHWEGFVKLSTQYFLEYVAMQRLLNQQLHPNLLALSLKSSINFLPETNNYSEYGKVTNFFLTCLTNRARLPFKDGLSTRSNLSSKVLKEILWCVGVDYAPYETKEKFIDSRLLGRRNTIAHGEKIYVDPREYDEMREIVVDMMTHLKNELENSASIGSYKRN
ncbi:MAG: MAE_28990/MAE_18760 family HEPN-like nuclease [Thermodesulfobacteriota bacterium]